MTAEAGVAPAAVWRNRIVGHADIAPAALVPNPRNWRTHPDDQQRALSGALAEVGWVAEVLVNQTTGHVVDGHLRLELALARGEPTVPVTYVDLSEDEERLVLASLDPLAAMARAEKEQLATLLAGLDPSDAALRAVLDDLAREFGLGTDRGGLVDPDVVPELPAEAFVSRGSLYELGDHRLLCGDSTDPTDVARLAGGGLADCLWTDPPYGVAYEGKTERHLRIRNDDPETSDDVIAGAFRLAPLGPS
ncbi:MAG TPA: ParB N-terminal domain-containing protein, partial [Candidatus Limnocylindrales bacterium]|nr:ParB N-terminal domain-containing protein [Candidatus Limnocylindrales bacterium]